MSAGDRVRLYSPPRHRSFSVPIETRRGRVVVTLGERTISGDAGLIAFQWTAQLVAVTSLVLAALLLWRKPSIMTVAFGAYAVGTLYGLPTAIAFGFLPDPLFSIVATSCPLSPGPCRASRSSCLPCAFRNRCAVSGDAHHTHL